MLLISAHQYGPTICGGPCLRDGVIFFFYSDKRRKSQNNFFAYVLEPFKFYIDGRPGR